MKPLRVLIGCEHSGTMRDAFRALGHDAMSCDLLPTERIAQARREGAADLAAVHARYFDLDGVPGDDDTTPAPEDVWRYDRDFRRALRDDA